METLIVSAILLLALVLFATELVPIDLTALLVVGALILTEVLTPAEGFSGFSHPAPVTVAAMLVLSAGLIRTGAVAKLGQKVSEMGGRSEFSQLAVIIPVIAVLSAFISNTAAVAMFIPLVLNIAREKNLSPSKMLLPLSYAAILGGACTYFGTSTNIIVGTIYADGGLPPLQMFEFTSLGLVLLGLGAVYMLTIGQRNLPYRPTEASLTEGYRLREYLTELVIRADSPLLDKTLRETDFSRLLGIEVLEIQRGNHKLRLFLQEIRLRASDILIVKGNLEKILKIRDTQGVDILAEVKLSDRDLKSEDVTLAEAVISPDSFLIGRTLKEANFRQRYQATALAIRRHGSQIRDKLVRVRLQVGDMLLVQVRKGVLGNLRHDSDFMLILEESQGSDFRFSKLPIAVLIFLGVIAAVASQRLPIELAALFGAVLMVLTRCITLRQGLPGRGLAYRHPDRGNPRPGNGDGKDRDGQRHCRHPCGVVRRPGAGGADRRPLPVDHGDDRDHVQQRHRGPVDPYRHLHCPSRRLGSPALCLLRGLCRLLQFPDPYRLSDQHHGVRPRGIPLYRLLQGGGLAEPHQLAYGHPADPTHLAVQLTRLHWGHLPRPIVRQRKGATVDHSNPVDYGPPVPRTLLHDLSTLSKGGAHQGHPGLRYETGREDIPVALGRPTPVVVGHPEISEPDPRQFSWAEGFTTVEPIDTPAVDFIADQLRRHPKQITLISVGPVSNLADLLQRDPQALQLAKSVYSMFGSYYLGYGSSPVPSAEWNVWADTPSARPLSSSTAPFTYAGLDVTAFVESKAEKRRVLSSQRSPLTDVLHAHYRLWRSRRYRRMGDTATK